MQQQPYGICSSCAQVEAGAIVAAGALVTPGTVVPSGGAASPCWVFPRTCCMLAALAGVSHVRCSWPDRNVNLVVAVR